MPYACGTTDSADLPLVHRLAIAYLVAPMAVWLLGWFHWWVGVPATALLAAGVWKALSGSWRWRRPSRATMVLALVAAAWVMTSPAGGVYAFRDAMDWNIHRATLLDLARGGWPTHPVDHLRDSSPLLRYYLGWHMIPTLTARWLGPAALNWAVPLWTWCGVTLVVLLFVRGLPTLRAALLAVAVFVFFGGMDVVELTLREGVPVIREKLDPSEWPTHGRSFDFIRTASSPMYLEYQSHMRVLWFAPQHFLPAGLGTLLMLQLRRRRRFLEASGVVLAACLFWSSLLATGLLVLAAAMLVQNPNARHVASWRNVFVAVPLAALLALYLTSGAVDFERGWLWELYDDRVHLAADIVLLYATEFLVLAALLWRLDRRVVRDPLFVAAIAMLLVAPWYYYGSRDLSEWTAKFTMPAVVVITCWAAHAVARRRARPARQVLVAVLAAGAVGVVWELGLVLQRKPDPLPYQTLGSTNLTVGLSSRAVRQRTTYSVSWPLSALLRDHEPTEADKGTLLIRSAYDVYLLWDNRLLYVNRDRCNRGDGQARTRFYADIYPADPRVLPPSLAEGYERLAFRLKRWRDYKEGGGCVIPVQLPGYEIARIETGQITEGGHVIWESVAERLAGR